MSRILATAALLALTVAAAQADTLADRVHSAAVKACAVEASATLPAAHYAAITQTCVSRISASALHQIDVAAEAKTKASTAALN